VALDLDLHFLDRVVSVQGDLKVAFFDAQLDSAGLWRGVAVAVVAGRVHWSWCELFGFHLNGRREG